LGSPRISRNGCDDDVNLQTDEIGCKVREAIASTLRIAVLEADVLSFNPSEVAETEPECLVPECGIGRRIWREKSYPGDFCRRLRARCARPSERACSESNQQFPTCCYVIQTGLPAPLAEGDSNRLSEDTSEWHYIPEL
jgi:hypothetical protein